MRLIHRRIKEVFWIAKSINSGGRPCRFSSFLFFFFSSSFFLLFFSSSFSLFSIFSFFLFFFSFFIFFSFFSFLLTTFFFIDLLLPGLAFPSSRWPQTQRFPQKILSWSPSTYPRRNRNNADCSWRTRQRRLRWRRRFGERQSFTGRCWDESRAKKCEKKHLAAARWGPLGEAAEGYWGALSECGDPGADFGAWEGQQDQAAAGVRDWTGAV